MSTARKTTARLRGSNAVLRRYETQQSKTKVSHNVSVAARFHEHAKGRTREPLCPASAGCMPAQACTQFSLACHTSAHLVPASRRCDWLNITAAASTSMAFVCDEGWDKLVSPCYCFLKVVCPEAVQLLRSPRRQPSIVSRAPRPRLAAVLPYLYSSSELRFR